MVTNSPSIRINLPPLNPIQRILNQSDMSPERAFDFIQPGFLFFEIVDYVAAQVEGGGGDGGEVKEADDVGGAKEGHCLGWLLDFLL